VLSLEEKEQLLAERLQRTWWVRAQGWVLIDVGILGALFVRHHDNLFFTIAIAGGVLLLIHRVIVVRARKAVGLEP
jgi:hypothetical protein